MIQQLLYWPKFVTFMLMLSLQTAILNDFNRIQNGQSPIQPMLHLLHCFDFIKQAILCCGDCTREPHLADRHGSHLQAGMGMDTLRVCKDFDKVLNYANAHAPKRIK